MPRLLVLSNTPHYGSLQDGIQGWGPTVIENDYISALFTTTLVMGFLHNTNVPSSALAYTNPAITFKPLPPSGGESLISKIKVMAFMFRYLFAIHQEVKSLGTDDWVYVRCPCNIGLLACMYLTLFRKPKRWFKYAGNWRPTQKEALSYTLQRFMLNRGICGGKVTVNGEWSHQPPHVLSFFNACIREGELQQAIAATKVKTITTPLIMLFAGRFEEEKGVYRILELAQMLKKTNIDFRINMAGDGRDKSDFIKRCQQESLTNHIKITGAISREELFNLYSESHLFLFPSRASEGWPKVLSEAMAYKCVPVASTVSSIPQIISKLKSGISKHWDLEEWYNAVNEFYLNKDYWNSFAERGQQAATNFTYEAVTGRLKHCLAL